MPRRNPILILRLAVGLVSLWQSATTLLHGSGAWSGHRGIAVILQGLAAIEIVAAFLFLIPATKRVGGWLLLCVFASAIAIHVLHGEWAFGGLVVYATAVWVTLAEDSGLPALSRAEA